MFPDAKLPSDAQRQALSHMIYIAFLETRRLGWTGKAQQAADLADAFHNLPEGMWRDDFSLSFFRDFMEGYREKYPEKPYANYVGMVDRIIAMTD